MKMTLPLALYHPGTLFGIQILVAAIVFAAVWFSSKAVPKTSLITLLALVLTAVATTLLARVPDPKKPGKPDSTALLVAVGFIVSFLVFGLSGVVFSYMNGWQGAGRGADEMSFLLMCIAGITVFVSWFFAAVFYGWRRDRAAAAAETPSKKPVKR